jgi:protein TonB
VNNANDFITRRARVMEALLWSGAALVTLGAHAGVVAWMLRADPVVAADNSPPAAIMVEVAAAPEAVQTEKDEITPDQTSADDSRPEEEQKQEETPQKEVVEEVKPDEVKPDQDEEIKDKTVVLEKAEVQLPPEPPKQKPKEKPKSKKKPRPRQHQASADSKAKRQAQVQARQSNRMAAAQTASGLSSMTPANWQSLLMAHLERRKRYPSGARERGERGTAYVRFSIDGGGNVLSARLVRSSGFSELDQEVVSLVHRASPVPAPPPGANHTITVPVRFNVN